MSKHFTLWGLLRYSLPSIFMMIFSSIYGIVDGIFVSNFTGKTVFSAVNLIIPYVMILSVVGFMIGAGGSAIVAKTRGEGDEKSANEYFSLLVYFDFLLGVALAIIGWFTMEPVSLFLGASDEMFEYCVVYGRILMLSLPFFTLQYVFQNFFVTAGKPGIGFAIIVVAGCTNIALDFLFIAVLGWGLEGAALATVIGEIIGGGVPLVYFFKRNSSFLRLGRTRFAGRIIMKACGNGSSEMVTNIAVSLVNMLYNFQLMRYIGADGVAAYGVIMYTWMIFGAIFIGFNIGTAPLLSYQYGAQNHIEMRSILTKSLGFVAIAGVLMFILGQVLAWPVSLLFVGYDQQLMEVTVQGFRIFAVVYLIMGFSIYGTAFFTALNNGAVSAFISFMRSLVFETTSVIVLPMIFGVIGIWLSVTVAELLSMALAFFFIVWLANRYGYSKAQVQKDKEKAAEKELLKTQS